MIGRLSMILLSGAIGLSLTGCSATSPTMRAQSPCEGGMCDPGNGGGMPYGMSAGCPTGAYCDSCQNCGPRRAGGINLPFHPVHRNFHTYKVPQNLKYPQCDNLQPAAYQYPYYTTRGPTDFFMQ